MIQFDSYSEAREYLLNLQKENPRIFFRGERKNYGTLRASIDREQYNNIERDKEIWYLGMLASHIHDYMKSIIESNQNIIVYSKLFEIYKHGDHFQVSAQESANHILHSLISLLQHYGWETNYLDVTDNIDVAAFFASYDFNNDNVDSSDFGYIHYFDFKEHFPPFQFLIYNLRPIAEVICELFGVKSNRPMMQNGFSIRILNDNNRKFINTIKKTIRFKRHGIERTLHKKDFLFPKDDLYLFLKSQELEYCFYILTSIKEEKNSYRERVERRVTNFHFDKKHWIV